MEPDHQRDDLVQNPDLHGVHGSAKSSVSSKQWTIRPALSRSLLGLPCLNRWLSTSGLDQRVSLYEPLACILGASASQNASLAPLHAQYPSSHDRCWSGTSHLPAHAPPTPQQLNPSPHLAQLFLWITPPPMKGAWLQWMSGLSLLMSGVCAISDTMWWPVTLAVSRSPPLPKAKVAVAEGCVL
eukprot:scaffold8620_cov62-Phaeocystis_antarctica.AAC.5